MVGVLRVGRNKKSPIESETEVAQDGGQSGEKYTVTVKLRASFKLKLDEVAADESKTPGQLIEEHLEKYINQQYPGAMRRKAEKALRAAEQAEREARGHQGK